MKFSLKRAFAAAALAGTTLVAGCQSVPTPVTDPNSPHLTPEEKDISSLVNSYGISLMIAHDKAVARPDMHFLATTALQNLADKSATDAFILTAEERQKLAALREEDDFNYQAYHISGTFYEVLMRAARDGTSAPEVREAALEVMRNTINKIDAHSVYHTDEEMFELQNQNAGIFGGVGLHVQMNNNRLTVGKVTPGSPSAHAKLQTNDVITHIDGIPTAEQSLEESVSKLRGDINTQVTITIERDGVAQPPVTLTRAYIENSPVTHHAIGPDIGYVSLSVFNEKATKDLENAINALKKELSANMRGLILDLRGNPGGLVSEAISISDLFLHKGGIVSMGNGGPDDQRVSARHGDILNGLPLIVLTDFSSASASEIVAGALQDNNRALILGTQSYGKGSVQSIIPFNLFGAQGGLRLTTALYFTPSGESIQGRGITPNIRYESEEIRRFLKEWGDRPLGEALFENMIDNPTPTGNKITTAICEPAPNADLSRVDKELRQKRSDGTESFDGQTACAVEKLRGTPAIITMTKPAPAPAPQI